ncbi:tetratricopeptide repeat protein [Mariprofundus erugo]|uniref:Tetratricopeptide repeat protein n=1 Tax=Mariprofundus erugo TaxID=2528639 RepID=A0A5R9GSR7_9PROT|nr:tetratricopeptide repeat protein [Mariprofundus erugo]TLS68960.1 tetratricopeptide repeat protein [Mariprofundus erugo]
MRRLLLVTAILLPLLAQSALAAGDRVQAARIFFGNGNPEQAISSAEKLLKKPDLSRDERSDLLSLIADAEILRTTHQHFEDIKPATHAIEALLQEFPDHPHAAHYRWQRAWLWWQAGDEKQAMVAGREIIAMDQQPASLQRVWLMMARIHIKQRLFAYARSDLLQYGLQVNNKSREQAVGMAWMAVVDQGEARNAPALQTLNSIYSNWPDVITDEPKLFSTYIHLLYDQQDFAKTLKLADAFIRQYITNDLAGGVRLIRADILSSQEKTIPTALMEYGILADTQAETVIGLKAFMRKLMLENRNEHDRDKLVPVMIALKKVADSNQLSVLEDEAMLDLARLWRRIAPSGSTEAMHAPALEAYAHAATSTAATIARAAHHEGSEWMARKLETILKNEQWLAAVTIWRQYPQLQPEAGKEQELSLGIAHAMRMLMIFDTAEEMLQELYKLNITSIRGQRIMVELAKLWMDRQDNDGVEKIMRWLNRNPFSIYRPEMLLIVARIQLEQHHPDLARQTLAGISADDVALESRASFWQASAGVSEALGEWHRAARDWQEYSKSPAADTQQGIIRQADALRQATEFASARDLYLTIAEEHRDAAWQYHLAICQLRSGEVAQGTQRLQELIDNKDAGRFATLAKLALADQQAGKLLGEKP